MTIAQTAMAPEAVFTSNYPNHIIRAAEGAIIFRNGEYRTSKPHEIDLLTRVAHDDRFHTIRIKELPALVLAPGPESEPARRRRADPSAPSPVLAMFIETLSNGFTPEERELLEPLERRLVGSLRSDAEEFQRASAVAVLAVLGVLVPSLRAADLAGVADQVERVGRIGDATIGQMAIAVLRQEASRSDDGWARAVLEAGARLTETVVRLTDWARIAGEFSTHAGWAAHDARLAQERATAARTASADGANEADRLNVETSSIQVDVAGFAEDTARSRLAARLASAIDVERLEAAWEQAEIRQGEATRHAEELADGAAKAGIWATVARQRASAAEGVAAGASDAHSSAARCSRTAAAAAIDLAELVAVRAAETIAIAAESPARAQILDQVRRVVESLAVGATGTRRQVPGDSRD